MTKSRDIRITICFSSSRNGNVSYTCDTSQMSGKYISTVFFLRERILDSVAWGVWGVWGFTGICPAGTFVGEAWGSIVLGMLSWGSKLRFHPWPIKHCVHSYFFFATLNWDFLIYLMTIQHEIPAMHFYPILPKIVLSHPFLCEVSKQQ